MIKVVFFHRKRALGNFSIENVFVQIRKNLPSEIECTVLEMRFISTGFFKRLYSCFEAFVNQGEVNHITGDIHFIALFLKKKRTVLTIHDIGFINHPNRVARIILKWLWLKLPVHRSAIITTVSVATKLEVLNYVNVHPSRIRVIYNPVSSLFTARPKPFDKNCPIILQIGTKPNKNIVRLAEALMGLSCRLHIIGELDEITRKALVQFGIDFTMRSNLTVEQVIAEYVSCDILSFVSTIEGFGLPIVEANTVGRVVVTSNLSSMPEIAGEAAHLVNPLDIDSIRAGFIKVISDQAYRDRLIINGFENKKRFDEKEIAKQYAAIYNELIH